jgi:tetratricopeptide (TPR) repeat protein
MLAQLLLVEAVLPNTQFPRPTFLLDICLDREYSETRNEGERLFCPLKLYFSLFVATAVQCFSAHMASADAGGSTCSDMTTHQQVLDAGSNYFQTHEGTTSSGTGGIHVNGTPAMFIPLDTAPVEGAFATDIVSEYAYQSILLPTTNLDTIRLTSESDLSSAELYAQAYEVGGNYIAAKCLYQRILAFRRVNFRTTVDSTLKDINRVDLCQIARGQFSNGAADYVQVLDSIASAKNINLKTKLALMKTISKEIAACKVSTVRLIQRAQKYCDDYKRELQCLYMAEDLNKAAFKLERNGMYAMAEKLYKEALAIKTKNLGVNDPDTLAQYGDLARLSGEQGHVTEAIALYEKALVSYRKLPSKGTGYSTLLQNYGDMLAQAKQQGKANQIYNEDKAFYACVAADTTIKKHASAI